MSKPIIAVDIDEVLQLNHIHFLNHHNKTYGTDFVYPDPQGRYYLQEVSGDSNDAVEIKLQKYINSDDFRKITPVDGAVSALNKLSDRGYGLVVVTARQSFYKDITEQFLNKHFAGVFDSVHFIPHTAHSAMSPSEDKLRICQEAGASYLIDDNLITAETFAAAGIPAILFGEYHWNKAEKLPKNVTRCKDWLEVLDYFEGRDD